MCHMRMIKGLHSAAVHDAPDVNFSGADRTQTQRHFA
jgi:hypothetical protein